MTHGHKIAALEESVAEIRSIYGSVREQIDIMSANAAADRERISALERELATDSEWRKLVTESLMNRTDRTERIERERKDLERRLRGVAEHLCNEQKESAKWHAEASKHSAHIQQIDAHLSERTQQLREAKETWKALDAILAERTIELQKSQEMLKIAERAWSILATCVRDDIVIAEARAFIAEHPTASIDSEEEATR
jgi:chromosome segregation ATPase